MADHGPTEYSSPACVTGRYLCALPRRDAASRVLTASTVLSDVSRIPSRSTASRRDNFAASQRNPIPSGPAPSRALGERLVPIGFSSCCVPTRTAVCSLVSGTIGAVHLPTTADGAEVSPLDGPCQLERFSASSDLTTKPAIPGDRCITFDQSCRRSVGEASLQCACSVSMSETSSGRSSLTDTIKESRRTGACNTAPRTRTHPTSRTRKQPLPSNRVTPPGGDSRQRACVKPGEVHPQWSSHGDM